MPYVPPEVKERIKREVSIQRLAEARGIKLRRVGRSLMGLCPFHKDTNPSLSIDPVKNEWHCFGCERKGERSRLRPPAEIYVTYVRNVGVGLRRSSPRTGAGMRS